MRSILCNKLSRNRVTKGIRENLNENEVSAMDRKGIGMDMDHVQLNSGQYHV